MLSNNTEKLKLLVDTCNDLIEKYSYQMETHAKTLGAYVVDEYMLEWDNFVDIVHDIGEDLKGWKRTHGLFRLIHLFRGIRSNKKSMSVIYGINYHRLQCDDNASRTH